MQALRKAPPPTPVGPVRPWGGQLDQYWGQFSRLSYFLVALHQILTFETQLTCIEGDYFSSDGPYIFPDRFFGMCQSTGGALGAAMSGPGWAHVHIDHAIQGPDVVALHLRGEDENWRTI